MIYQNIFFAFILTFLACTSPPNPKDINKEIVIQEVQQMLDNYHKAIQENGLTAEFDYLDHSKDFFWVPPGYTSALTYDSVKTILETNATLFVKVEFHWKSLQIIPLTNEISNYYGIVEGILTDTAGFENNAAIIESGTVIKRPDGWKLLSGQSTNLSAPTSD
jgi:hypothetical protein